MTDPWTPERIAALESLWDVGLSTREIGLKLGITKNAVVGKAHRLGLSKRNAPVAEPPPVAQLVRLEALGAGMCCWPDGEPGTPEFRFCGEPSLVDKPYCAEHCERAYVRGGKDTSNTVAA
ncbi:MAG: GcrA family cell cycle regulator [Rhodospirillales bacterium]|jgi:GcrA cell cycle regulator|nr:GcrA family cell cycle regulator [Rhodospirillales bacterium]